ncbi:O-antigen ligase domain-containing protein [Phormidium tenue FACHB-886]|nr:O-antigen ligase domain-containing protein [Phormidium tenue FACHB-886]
MNYVFPAGAFVVGFFLYLKQPVLYVCFSWWLWFLSPLVRRLVDYQSGFTNPSPILLSPFLVTLLILPSILLQLPTLYRQGGLPFIFAFAGIFYGFLLGLIQGSPSAVTVALLDWLVPVLLSCYLFLNWRNYLHYRQAIQNTFVWGVLITGSYGIYQYLVAPEWDRFWLLNLSAAGLVDSFGRPEPMQIRVWSTMNGPLDFAVVMMAGLLLLFSYQGVLRLPASGAGYLAFLLSLARTAWGGWFVGVALLFSSLKSSLQLRFLLTFAILGLLVIPLITIEPFSEVIQARVESLFELFKDDDGSGQERSRTYTQLIGLAVMNVWGDGIGNIRDFGRPLDSAFLVILFSLGWLGTLLYTGGYGLLLLQLFQGRESSIDSFAATARAISLTGAFMMLFGPIILGVSGAVIWGFLGIGMAARKYYLHQHAYGFKT